MNRYAALVRSRRARGHTLLGVVFLSCSLVCVLGCSTPAPARDGTGATEHSALASPVAQQYDRAASHYRELQRRLGETQQLFYRDAWLADGVRSEVMPFSGRTRSDTLPGARADTAYAFAASRWHAVTADIGTTIDRAVTAWKAAGYDVTRAEHDPRSTRVTASTPDQFWYEVLIVADELKITVFTPLYWGNHPALVTAIAERRDAESDAAASSTDQKPQVHQGSDPSPDQAERLPGVFRSFPEWEAVP